MGVGVGTSASPRPGLTSVQGAGRRRGSAGRKRPRRTCCFSAEKGARWAAGARAAGGPAEQLLPDGRLLPLTPSRPPGAGRGRAWGPVSTDAGICPGNRHRCGPRGALGGRETPSRPQQGPAAQAPPPPAVSSAAPGARQRGSAPVTPAWPRDPCPPCGGSGEPATAGCGRASPRRCPSRRRRGGSDLTLSPVITVGPEPDPHRHGGRGRVLRREARQPRSSQADAGALRGDPARRCSRLLSGFGESAGILRSRCSRNPVSKGGASRSTAGGQARGHGRAGTGRPADPAEHSGDLGLGRGAQSRPRGSPPPAGTVVPGVCSRRAEEIEAETEEEEERAGGAGEREGGGEGGTCLRAAAQTLLLRRRLWATRTSPPPSSLVHVRTPTRGPALARVSERPDAMNRDARPRSRRTCRPEVRAPRRRAPPPGARQLLHGCLRRFGGNNNNAR